MAVSLLEPLIHSMNKNFLVVVVCLGELVFIIFDYRLEV